MDRSDSNSELLSQKKSSDQIFLVPFSSIVLVVVAPVHTGSTIIIHSNQTCTPLNKIR